MQHFGAGGRSRIGSGRPRRIARLAWQQLPSAENDAAFGQAQSLVPGPATNVQVSVKASKRFADTGGWGYGRFEDGEANRSAAAMAACAPCHARAPGGDDFVFTRYAP